LRFVKDFDDFLDGGLFQGLAPALQRFRKSDGCVLHALVRFAGAANQQEVFVLREPLVTVLVIQTDADEPDDSMVFLVFLFSLVGHGTRSLSDRIRTEIAS